MIKEEEMISTQKLKLLKMLRESPKGKQMRSCFFVLLKVFS